MLILSDNNSSTIVKNSFKNPNQTTGGKKEKKIKRERKETDDETGDNANLFDQVWLGKHQYTIASYCKIVWGKTPSPSLLLWAKCCLSKGSPWLSLRLMQPHDWVAGLAQWVYFSLLMTHLRCLFWKQIWAARLGSANALGLTQCKTPWQFSWWGQLIP